MYDLNVSMKKPGRQEHTALRNLAAVKSPLWAKAAEEAERQLGWGGG